MMPKILIVSDDFIFVTLLEARLLMNGYEVFIARDGVLGLKMARELGPQLIVLDAALPKMSGYRLVEKLKNPEDTLRRIPIIVVADRAPVEYLFREADVFHFCSKPVIPAQFLKQVAAAVQSAQAPKIFEKKVPERSEGKSHVLLAGVQEFIVGKLKNFFEQKEFVVDIGWNEDDLVQKVVRIKPDYVFVQFWEELSILNTPGIVKKLMQSPSLRSVRVFVFCAENVYRDAMSQMPQARLIAFSESEDLLTGVERVLKPGSASAGRRQAAS